MATNKITQKDKYNAIIARLNGQETEIPTEDLIAFAQERIAQIDKKNANRKTEENTEKIENAQKVLAWMRENPEKKYLLSEIRKHFNLSSPQKTSPIVTHLVDNGLVARTTEKSTVYYTVI